MLQIKDYIIMALGLLLASTYFIMEDKVTTIQEEKESIIKDIAVCEANRFSLTRVIEDMNKDIEIYKVDINKSVSELEEWKSKPEVIKYVNIYKTVSDINISRSDCETYEDISNSFNGFSLNQL